MDAAASGSRVAGSSSRGEGSSAGGSATPQSFECNICLHTPSDPVVTECGHLYCWSCLFKWMQTKSACPLCPVCKSKVEKSKVIPVYGRGMQNHRDPREETTTAERVPPRPTGRRTEAPGSTGSVNFGHGYGLPQNRFGNPTFGTFSFTLVPSLFGLHFQYPPTTFGNPNVPTAGAPTGQAQQANISAEQEQQDLISKLLLLCALFVIFCLLFT